MQASAGRSVMVQGRLVWTSGDLFKGRIKQDMNTKQPKRNAAGDVMMEYGFGLAVPKSILGDSGPGRPGEIWMAIHEEAFTLFPNRQIPPSFAMKYKDGDGIDDKGQPFALREGYANHLVFACTTSLPIKYFKFENNQNIMINEGIKCGDYVNVQLHVKAHPAFGQGKAGLYLNPNAVQFLGFGKEIVNTPSGDQIFGTAMPAVPQGASLTPIAPAGMIVPQGYPPQAPPVYAQPQVQAAPPAHYGVVPPQFQPPPGGQPVGNAPPQPQYPVAPSIVPGPAAAQPMGYSTGVPSFATNVAPGINSGMPGIPYPQQ